VSQDANHQNFPTLSSFSTPQYSKPKKNGLSHISCDICLFGWITIVNHKTRQTKMNTNPKKRTRFPPIEGTKFVPSSSSFFEFACVMTIQKQRNMECLKEELKISLQIIKVPFQ
jgi:hypothetical protein